LILAWFYEERVELLCSRKVRRRTWAEATLRPKNLGPTLAYEVR